MLISYSYIAEIHIRRLFSFWLQRSQENLQWKQQQSKESLVEARDHDRRRSEYNRLAGTEYDLRGILSNPSLLGHGPPSTATSDSSVISTGSQRRPAKGQG